jgi:hypothetical protein
LNAVKLNIGWGRLAMGRFVQLKEVPKMQEVPKIRIQDSHNKIYGAHQYCSATKKLDSVRRPSWSEQVDQ